MKMVGKTDREKSRENCVGAGKRRSNEAPKEQTIWGVGGGGGGGGGMSDLVLVIIFFPNLR